MKLARIAAIALAALAIAAPAAAQDKVSLLLEGCKAHIDECG